MSTCTFLLWLSPILLGIASSAETSSGPNFIIFNVDMNAMDQWTESQPSPYLEDTIASYTKAPTPYLHDFRTESIIFPSAYTSSPVCSPSRYSLLTGRYAARSAYAISKTLESTNGMHGTYIDSTEGRMSGYDSMYNLPTMLHSAGYYTGFVGKWHLMAGDFGGDECDELKYERNPTLYEECVALVKYNTGFDFVDAFYIDNIKPSSPYDHNPEWILSQSQKCIESSVAQNQPFFLYISPTLCHNPKVLTDGDNVFIDHDYTESPKGTLTGDDIPNDTQMMHRALFYQYLVDTGYDNNEKGASAMWMDEMFGALINYLKSNGLYHNTFIVFQNDHGVIAKKTLYQEGIQTIQFVRYPPLFGVNGPYILSQDLIVAQYDTAAVIFEIADIDIPAQYVMDGQSWLTDVRNALLHDEDTDDCCNMRYSDIFYEHSIVTKRYKYIFKATNNGQSYESKSIRSKYTYFSDLEQLYDLKTDPSEQRNLVETYHALSHSQKKKLHKFRRKMDEYIADIGCPLIDDVDECITPSTRYDDDHLFDPDDVQTLYTTIHLDFKQNKWSVVCLIIVVMFVSLLFCVSYIKKRYIPLFLDEESDNKHKHMYGSIS